MSLRLLFGLPLITIVSVLPLLFHTAPPAAVISSSLLHEPLQTGSGMPLLSRMLAAHLLHLLPQADEGPAAPGAHPPAAGPVVGGLARLSRDSSPHLALCRAPTCGAVDMLILTLLHRRVRRGSVGAAGAGATEEPFVGLVEQWGRPASSFIASPSAAPAAESLLRAAEAGGDAGVLSELVRIARRQLAAPAVGHAVDPHTWSLLWRSALPGPAEHMALSVGGALAAVSFRIARGEGEEWRLRLFALHAMPCGGDPDEAGRPPPFETVSLPGGSPVTALAVHATLRAPGARRGAAEPPAPWQLPHRECLLYARAYDLHSFRTHCRYFRLSKPPTARGAANSSARSGAEAGLCNLQRRRVRRWVAEPPGPLVDRSVGPVATTMIAAALPWPSHDEVLHAGAQHRPRGFLHWARRVGQRFAFDRTRDRIGASVLLGELKPFYQPAEPTTYSEVLTELLAAEGVEEELAVGFMLRMLSPRRAPPCRRLRRLLRRCGARGGWVLRAATNAQLASPTADAAADARAAAGQPPSAPTPDGLDGSVVRQGPGDGPFYRGDGSASLWRLPRPLLGSSCDGTHVAVAYGRTISTLTAYG